MNPINTNDLKVIYVHFVGVDSDGLNIYHLLISDNPSGVFGDEWGEKPACNCINLMPNENSYDYVKELRTTLILDLAQDECCHSMQDAKDQIVALAAENLDDYTEYPEDGRVVIHFGQSIDEVDAMLSMRELETKYI